MRQDKITNAIIKQFATAINNYYIDLNYSCEMVELMNCSGECGKFIWRSFEDDLNHEIFNQLKKFKLFGKEKQILKLLQIWDKREYDYMKNKVPWFYCSRWYVSMIIFDSYIQAKKIAEYDLLKIIKKDTFNGISDLIDRRILYKK